MSDGSLELTDLEKTRLTIAKEIAAGMCANPQTYLQQGWHAQVVNDSLRIADKLIVSVRTGGC